MNVRWLILLGVVTACASVEPLLEDDAPSGDGGVHDATTLDSGLDANAIEVDGAPCADCEYFPEACSPDVFCPNGPFDPGGGLDPRTQVNVIRGRAPNDVWAAGALGALAHFDGAAWTRSDPGSQETLRALWVRGSGEVSFGLLARLYARGLDVPDGGAASDGGWTLHSPSFVIGDDPGSPLLSAWAASGSNVLWCSVEGSNQGSSGGIWRVRHQRSAAFEIERVASASARSIHGLSADDVWAVGREGGTYRITVPAIGPPTVQKFNSQTWNALSGVWVASESEAWSVGAMGTIRHFVGDPLLWDIVSNVPTIADLNAVWGSSASDVWAVGDAGVVLHYDGNAWSRVKIAGLGKRRPNLGTVWVASPGHVWIGGQGTIVSLGGKP